jgi:hypothetical protein
MLSAAKLTSNKTRVYPRVMLSAVQFSRREICYIFHCCSGPVSGNGTIQQYCGKCSSHCGITEHISSGRAPTETAYMGTAMANNSSRLPVDRPRNLGSVPDGRDVEISASLPLPNRHWDPMRGNRAAGA